MFTCPSCGTENANGDVKFCNQCGASKQINATDMNPPEQVNRYARFIEEIYFSNDALKVDEISRITREKLKITINEHRRITEKLSVLKKKIGHFFQFKLEFNQNVRDAYAGHDTYLKFRFTNLSESEFFKVNLVWVDPESTNEMDLNIQGGGLVHPHASLDLGGSHIFPRMGRKEISNMRITVTDQIGDSANFKIAPFSFSVQSPNQRITRNVLNQISIEGRGVVDANGMGADSQDENSSISNQPNWINLSFEWNNDTSIQYEKNNVKSNQAPTSKENGAICKFGYLSAYNFDVFFTDKERRVAVLEDVWILLAVGGVMSIRDFLSLLEKFVQQVKDVHPTPPLLVVAEAFSAEVFATLAINQLRGILNTFPLMIGPTESIEDFAVLTSGTLCKTSTAPINSDLKNIEELEIRDLGYAKLIDITEHSMKIIGGRGGKQDILKRMIFIEQEIKEAEKETENEIRISQLKARLSLLKSALGD